MKTRTLPQALFVIDKELAFADVKRQRVGGVRLQLKRMGAGPGGGLHDLQGSLERLIVVPRHLGDDERLYLSSDLAVTDAHPHLVSSACAIMPVLPAPSRR